MAADRAAGSPVKMRGHLFIHLVMPVGPFVSDLRDPVCLGLEDETSPLGSTATGSCQGHFFGFALYLDRARDARPLNALPSRDPSPPAMSLIPFAPFFTADSGKERSVKEELRTLRSLQDGDEDRDQLFSVRRIIFLRNVQTVRRHGQDAGKCSSLVFPKRAAGFPVSQTRFSVSLDRLSKAWRPPAAKFGPPNDLDRFTDGSRPPAVGFAPANR